MNRPRLLCMSLVLCGMLVGAARPASAELITFQFDGVVTAVNTDLAGDFAAGDVFSYTLGIETDPMTFNSYHSHWYTFAGSIGDYEFQGVGGGSFAAQPAANTTAQPAAAVAASAWTRASTCVPVQISQESALQ